MAQRGFISPGNRATDPYYHTHQSLLNSIYPNERPREVVQGKPDSVNNRQLRPASKIAPVERPLTVGPSKFYTQSHTQPSPTTPSPKSGDFKADQSKSTKANTTALQSSTISKASKGSGAGYQRTDLLDKYKVATPAPPSPAIKPSVPRQIAQVPAQLPLKHSNVDKTSTHSILHSKLVSGVGFQRTMARKPQQEPVKQSPVTPSRTMLPDPVENSPADLLRSQVLPRAAARQQISELHDKLRGSKSVMPTPSTRKEELPILQRSKHGYSWLLWCNEDLINFRDYGILTDSEACWKNIKTFSHLGNYTAPKPIEGLNERTLPQGPIILRELSEIVSCLSEFALSESEKESGLIGRRQVHLFFQDIESDTRFDTIEETIEKRFRLVLRLDDQQKQILGSFFELLSPEQRIFSLQHLLNPIGGTKEIRDYLLLKELRNPKALDLVRQALEILKHLKARESVIFSWMIPRTEETRGKELRDNKIWNKLLVAYNIRVNKYPFLLGLADNPHLDQAAIFEFECFIEHFEPAIKDLDSINLKKLLVLWDQQNFYKKIGETVQGICKFSSGEPKLKNHQEVKSSGGPIQQQPAKESSMMDDINREQQDTYSNTKRAGYSTQHEQNPTKPAKMQPKPNSPRDLETGQNSNPQQLNILSKQTKLATSQAGQPTISNQVGQKQQILKQEPSRQLPAPTIPGKKQPQPDSARNPPQEHKPAIRSPAKTIDMMKSIAPGRFLDRKASPPPTPDTPKHPKPVQPSKPAAALYESRQSLAVSEYFSEQPDPPSAHKLVESRVVPPKQHQYDRQQQHDRHKEKQTPIPVEESVVMDINFDGRSIAIDQSGVFFGGKNVMNQPVATFDLERYRAERVQKEARFRDQSKAKYDEFLAEKREKERVLLAGARLASGLSKPAPVVTQTPNAPTTGYGYQPAPAQENPFLLDSVVYRNRYADTPQYFHRPQPPRSKTTNPFED